MATSDPGGGWRARLVEMEEQLHALAADLAEDLGEPAPEPVSMPAVEPRVKPQPAVAPPGEPEPSPGPRPAEPNPNLEAMCARLLAAMREMLAGYELALTHVVTGSSAGPAVTVAAGPFGSVALLERFEDALRNLPEVRDVAVRGYEGRDHAVLEVHLTE